MYEEQMQRSAGLEKTLADEPDPFFEEMLADRRKVQAILLKETVHYAIKTDDPNVLQRLADAGAKLAAPLKDGTYPMDLAKGKPNVEKWLTNYIRQQITSNPELLLAARLLAQDAAAKSQAVIVKMLEQTRDDIKSTFKFFNYDDAKEEKPAAKLGVSEPPKAAGK